MSEQKHTEAPKRKAEQAQPNAAAKAPKKKKKGGGFGRFIRRFLLLFFTIIVLIIAGLALAANLVFNGPSVAARNVLTMTLLEPSATKWIPGLFMDEEVVKQIQNAGKGDMEETETATDLITIDRTSGIGVGGSSEWEGHPDGIRIEEYQGQTFNAHIMIIRDPSQVYLGLSTYDGFSVSKPGKRLNVAMDDENALAAVNAGAFNDDGTANATVGSVPAGLTIHDCKVVSNAYTNLVPEEGFCGFNTDDILVVAKSMTEAEAMEKNIRDGCEFGPVLIINGEVNQDVYSGNSGYNPRTAVGQRADGAVIFVCADGRQAGSMGATYKDIIDIMVEYGAVNACNMDGGSSSIMLYRDTQNLFPDKSEMPSVKGQATEVKMINSYSVLQSEPRRMPNFWMVKAAE